MTRSSDYLPVQDLLALGNWYRFSAVLPVGCQSFISLTPISEIFTTRFLEVVEKPGDEFPLGPSPSGSGRCSSDS